MELALLFYFNYAVNYLKLLVIIANCQLCQSSKLWQRFIQPSVSLEATPMVTRWKAIKNRIVHT